MYVCDCCTLLLDVEGQLPHQIVDIESISFESVDFFLLLLEQLTLEVCHEVLLSKLSIIDHLVWPLVLLDRLLTIIEYIGEHTIHLLLIDLLLLTREATE